MAKTEQEENIWYVDNLLDLKMACNFILNIFFKVVLHSVKQLHFHLSKEIDEYSWCLGCLLVLGFCLLSDFSSKKFHLQISSSCHSFSSFQYCQSSHILPFMIYLMSIPLSGCLTPRPCITHEPEPHSSHIAASKHSPASAQFSRWLQPH